MAYARLRRGKPSGKSIGLYNLYTMLFIV